MKNINLGIVFVAFSMVAICMNIFSAYAITTSTLDLSNIPTLTSAASNITGNNELLYINNGRIDVVPNTYATNTAAYSNINLGAYASYPNPNGMFNTYLESTTSQPILGASFMGKTNSYLQGVFVQNLAAGSAASGDIVIANDKGSATSTTNYADFGIANSGQNDSDHSLIQPYDAYLYNQTGRLLLGSSSQTASSSIILSVGMGSTSPKMTIDQYGHVITSGTKPSSLSGCGTNPSVAGNDTNGVITLGTGLSVTACTMNFANAFPAGSTVSCTASSNSLLSVASVSSVSTTALSLGLSISLASGKVYYHCMAFN